ncbi:hypothetical protein QN372_15405 [Undibacterium sp. RTI2.1]|nr:hypothetical protein [Undibacterium sp. RTI2.1]MEB0032146.1 hypothetical protein [Undibacterium sp. RTI2.1]MEB0118324.1 hypothetical protein [Undibacterium sp. RTI2.2]
MQDREDLQTAETVIQRIRSGEEQATPIEDVIATLKAGYACQTAS